MPTWLLVSSFFFFNDTATTEIYTLSLHDALPISPDGLGLAEIGNSIDGCDAAGLRPICCLRRPAFDRGSQDRKSTRLNSSHSQISYAVFCLKKKKNNTDSTSSYPTHYQLNAVDAS